jgi:MFS family permease
VPKKPAVALPRALPPLGAAALVFLAAGTVLMLEILAVRLLAPYVGLTLQTTTAIIGAALAGIAAGAAIGGQLADRTKTRRLIVLLLIGGGLLALLIVPIVHLLGPGARGSGEFAALGITFITLMPAAARGASAGGWTVQAQLSGRSIHWPTRREREGRTGRGVPTGPSLL